MLFAEGQAIITDSAAMIAGVGAVITAIIIRIESISKVMSDIKMSWFKATNENDSVVVRELKESLAGVKSDLVATKAEVVDLKSEVVMINHEQVQCLLQEERLWGYITLIYDYATRQSGKLEEQGLTVEPPPAAPERRERLAPTDAFQVRTKATNARLAKEASGVLPVPVLISIPPVPGAGQT